MYNFPSLHLFPYQHLSQAGWRPPVLDGHHPWISRCLKAQEMSFETVLCSSYQATTLLYNWVGPRCTSAAVAAMACLSVNKTMLLVWKSYISFSVKRKHHSLSGVYISSRVKTKKWKLARHYHIFLHVAVHYVHCIMHNAGGPNATQV